MPDYNRRAVIAGATALSALSFQDAYAKRRPLAPSDTVRMGLIGCKGMGWADMKAHLKVPGVEFTALCDIDDKVLADRGAEFQTLTGKAPAIHRDYRRLLDDQSVDAVVIATPDHWHCLMATDACSAQKDVYCEKPLANTIAECQAMVAAKNRSGSVIQVGQWQRSNQHWADAINFVQSGKLGRVRLVKVFAYMPKAPRIMPQPDGPVPAGVNYDMWLGPAPLRPFNPNRFHYTFRWFWDYAGGTMTDWGVHLMDMALMGMKAGTPKSVMSFGGKYAYPDAASETPDTQTAVFDYGDYSIQWEHSLGIGTAPYGDQPLVAFIGELGTLVVDRSQWHVLPEKSDTGVKMEAVPVTKASDNGLDRHAENFIACLKERSKTPNCPIEAAANVATVCHMGNIAYRTGDRIEWDASKRKFVANAKANGLITPKYRAPWKLPALV